ncbi:N-acetyltransferase B complex non catalytic subunit-domain-containing protein [Thelonectria olida]|uniref:N-acetyltransferase B complex non catalytic subunit-domain-containing protein n=1 Tax=Thelonectria olida TaxID=1576542 RepID=A0A9P8WDP2_9HYPO|nr:N-acetyltransferase B complex non catalytic subunit-domain-containing protein [Thelonectria olida]
MNRQRPNLKNGVDFQLQTAFNDGNWAVVIRLADKRAKALNDQYYEILKICAESQLDDPTAKFAAVAATAKFVKEGTVVKDVDAIDLLEWASQGLTHEEEFAETLGPLRVRLVKAAPKDKISATRCMESCLLHWDLVSAQQIAAIIDRSFPAERSFLFWNIAITHHLAISPQAPPEKKKLYGMLALKQIQRAAQLAEADDTTPTPRSIQTEEEILLLYEVVEKHGTAEDFKKIVDSKVFSPLTQFKQGRKELFLRVVTKHQRAKNWEAVYELCHGCLSTTDENDQPSLMASDWAVWRYFIEAATELKTSKPEVESTVHELLVAFIKRPNLRPIYKRVILLASVSAVFASNDFDDVVDGQPASPRLMELANYISDQRTSPACFDDIKAFVEKLSPSAIKYIAYHFTPRLAQEARDEVETGRIQTLALKLQYLAATCPSMYDTVPGAEKLRRCRVSDEEVDSSSPGPCFATIAQYALALHKSLSDIDHIAVDAEINPELAVLVALCNIQTAFPPSTGIPNSPVSLAPLLRATTLLENQLEFTPKHGIISLLLVQLHLRLGSASRAREIWETLGVKRTIMDSLAPIFYDRLSTIAPSLISPNDTWGWELVDLLHSHYFVSLRMRMPRRLIDAFESNSYGSIIDIPQYMEALRWSCTRAMSLVEESRTERQLGLSFAEVLLDDRFTEVTDETELKDVIDYGSFPMWDCSSRPTVYSRLQVGPKLTNRRAHLSLLSEAFHEVLSYKPPSQYKASAAAAIPDQTFFLEMMTRLSNSFAKFLNGPTSDLTPEEAIYFDTISLLATLVPFAIGISRSAPIPPVLAQIVAGVTASIDTLTLRVKPDTSGVEGQLAGLGSLHGVAIFRDTAEATKQAAHWIITYNERQKERDRSGSTSLPKEVVNQIKELLAAAEAALKDGKVWMSELKDRVNGRDFDRAVGRFIFAGQDKIHDLVGDEAVGRLVDYWHKNMEGWKEVKWT